MDSYHENTPFIPKRLSQSSSVRTIDSHIFLYVVLFKVILSFDDVLRVQVRAVLLTSQALFRDFLMKRNTARLFF